MKRVKVKRGHSVHVGGRPWGPGQELELEDEEAAKLVDAGAAVEVAKPKKKR